MEQGGSAFNIYSTDMEGIFRQEGYFHYLFGVEEEDYFGAIDIRDGKTMLFMPRLPDSYAVQAPTLRDLMILARSVLACGRHAACTSV